MAWRRASLEVFTGTLFGLDCGQIAGFGGPTMSVSKVHWCWRKDLAEFRGLSDFQRSGFLLVLEWFENFRLRHGLEAGKDAARSFWRTEVKCEGRPREEWSRKRLRLTRSS